MKSAVVSSNMLSVREDEIQGLIAEKRMALAAGNPAPERPQPSFGRLTPRQVEVLALLCEGLPNKLICRQLNISAGTVKAHISGILRELGVASRLQAVVAARRRGLIREAGAAGADTTPRSTNDSRYAVSDAVRALDFAQRSSLNRFAPTPQRT